MGKVWNFEGNGVDYLTPLKDLLSEYRDGLNSQQDYLKARFEFGVDLERVISFVDFYVDRYQFFRVNIFTNGKFDVTLYRGFSTANENKIYSDILDIQKLEKYLDKLIASDGMANAISHLIRIKRFSAINNILVNEK